MTNCDFQNSSGLTLEQLQSTWNWKVGRLNSVELPPCLRAEVDEKPQKDRDVEARRQET